ncbi:MAG: NAD(P)/FAD-dependent oxidoreductase [Syntrophaceae bacterium]
MQKYDVCIVGAGPGGSMTARAAAQAGLNTVFLERSQKVGEKNASGCGLGQHWWRDFPEIMEQVERLPSFREITHCFFKVTDEDDRLITSLGTGWTKLDDDRIVYKGKGRGMTGCSIYRCDLDPLLADMACDAGAELRTSTLVTDVIKDNGRVKGVVTDKGEKIAADIVIAADGAHSTIAIKSGIRKRFAKKDITLVPQFDFSADPAKMDDVIGAAEQVWFGPFCAAYQVNFHDGFHLGAGQWLDIWSGKRPVELLTPILKIPAFQAMCRAMDARMREFQVHLLPWMPHPSNAGKTYGDGVLLVGDAGGFPCPLEAEGVWHACVTGKIAAEVAAQAISTGNPSRDFLKEYERRWEESSIGEEYHFGKQFVGLWRATAFDPVFMKTMGRFIGEMQSLAFPGPVFDWSTSHMQAINDHLGHFLSLLPQMSAVVPHIKPLGRGISDANRATITELIVGSIKKKVPIIPTFVTRPLVRKMLGKAGRP